MNTLMTAAMYRLTLGYIRRGGRRVGSLPWKGAMVLYCFFAIGAFFALNGIYQVVRKPGEILAPLSASLSKSPALTWQRYGSVFEKHSTSIISPEFLAALAQVEGEGNPIARTYWRWRWSWNLLDIYRPASTALGMFQITDGTFAAARKHCIRDHEVATEGPWYDLRSCWFNSLYTRILASHSAEMTAAYLHRKVVDTLSTRPTTKVGPDQKEKLAAVIHLCGPKGGMSFAKRGFHASPDERCGTHGLRRYLTKVGRMKRHFAQLREQQ